MKLETFRHYLKFRSKVAAFIDGELEQAELERIRSHLEKCPVCREEANRILTVSQQLKGLPRLEPSLGLWVKLERSLVLAPFGGAGREGRPRAYRLKPVPVLALLALTLIAFYLFITLLVRKENTLITPTYAFDIGLYMDAIGKRSESLLRKFQSHYDAKPVSLAEAREKVGFKILAPESLPGGFSFSGGYLLKSGCCSAAQLNYRMGDKQLYIFEQPVGHPTSCSGRRIEDYSLLPKGKRASDGKYSAYIWDAEETNVILIADLDESQALNIIAFINGLASGGK